MTTTLAPKRVLKVNVPGLGSQSALIVTWQTGLPDKAIQHAVVQLGDGRVVPARYSEVNHCWMGWNGTAYDVVWPVRWADLVVEA